jgi:formylglycine-generating enzyme required for sulfatase activity
LSNPRVVARAYDRRLDTLDPPKELDDYVIGRELGRGTGGHVYLAEDAVLARPVAIKFIAHLGAGARQQFLQEARTVAKIHHPNVVAIYRVGTYQQRPYLATELVRGASLAELAKPLPWADALDIAIGVARGLAAVHRVNVVHCDLKPGNVVIDEDGVAKIIDFGTARAASEGGASGHAPVGTPDYVAPEVWRGEAPGKRADVYALGAVLFELVSGAPPFADVPSSALAHRVMTGEAPALRDRAVGVDPELAAVVARCLSRDPAARYADGDELREALERLHASRRHTVRTGENPYRGLLPFEASHRGLFFGRRSEVDAVVERLRGTAVVLVTGDSGVGKSSLCRAGVVPAVVDGELGGAWQALTIVPGERPLSALASALGEPVGPMREDPARLVRALRKRAGDGGLIAFIDQLEELITLGDPVEVAALDAGLAELIDGVPGLRLLATVRADFLARLSTLAGLGRDLSRLLYFLRPLPPERLRDVIVGPAEIAGVRFESPAIVDELVAATAEAGSGGLPLLSFALADLWEARDGNEIPERAVAAMGGVAGALSRHADVVIGQMVAAERAQARRVLLRLVTAMGTRARRTARELALDDLARDALDALVRGRLVVVHEGDVQPVYELAHECLLTGWGTLRRWLDEDTAGRAIRERLSAAASEWLRLGRPGDATWHGRRLAEALALDPTTLSLDDRAFVAASRRAARWRRVQAAAAAVLVVALITAVYVGQRYVAARERAAEVNAELFQARINLVNAVIADGWADLEAAQAFTVFDQLDRDAGEQLWGLALHDRARAHDDYRKATSHLETAFTKDASRADVRALYGDILLARVLRGERLHDRGELDELIERLAAHDDDHSRRAELVRPGLVTVHAPPGAAVAVSPGGPIAIGQATSLAPGSYVVTVQLARAVVRAPILVERGRRLVVDIAPPPRDLPAGFVYVPAGDFLYGNPSDDDTRSFFLAQPQHPRRTEAFLIARHEVTFEDWLSFLDALRGDERARRLPGPASGASGGVTVTPDGKGHWRLALQIDDQRYTADWGAPLVYVGRDRRASQDWRRMPVIGVSAEDAEAYAKWLDRTGRVPGARLCNELEWERAARGADGREYPAGAAPDGDDADIDITYGTAHHGPDEVGLHPASRSPYELDDMIGNANELTRSEIAREYILRGGDYGRDRKSANLTNRSPVSASTKDAFIGVRMCATPGLPR